MTSVNLAPLSLGELLDQTFSTFRKHFWLFAGIMLLPEAIIVGLGIAFQLYIRAMVSRFSVQNPHAATQSAAQAMRAGLFALSTLIPDYVVYALALGATTYALSEVYLGRTTTIRDSYRMVVSRFWRLVKVIFAILIRSLGAFILVMFIMGVLLAGVAPVSKSMAWVSIVVGLLAIMGFILAGILAVIFLMRYGVAVPALVVEKLSTRQALRRSVALTKGYLWRLLVVAILMTLISITLVSLCQMPFAAAAFILTPKGAQPALWLTIPSMLLRGLSGAATTPLFMISFCIAYYDLRVRKEGFDLQLMLSHFDETGPQSAPGSQPLEERAPLEDASIFGMCLLTFLTAGLYLPFWFISRRKALNSLRSQEKVGVLPAMIVLVGLLASIGIPTVGSIKWGSWIEAENAVGAVHPLILVFAVTILIVQSFKVRRILLDHLAPREEGMFSASVRFQYEDLFSQVWTFVLGIFYIQHMINGLLERFQADEGRQEKTELALPQPSPVPRIIL